VVYFYQREREAPRTLSISTSNKDYPVGLKGRAWIAAASGQVLHIETNLLQGIAYIDPHTADTTTLLRGKALSVDYGPIEFQSKNVRLWLPQFAMAYTDLGKHRLIAQHTFSSFRLFSIATGQVTERTETSQPRER
jgi:hypothetical protein